MATFTVLLVAEEEEDFSFISDLLLAGTGDAFRINWAHSFEDGMEALEYEQYDVVLVDYDLGFHTGSEFVQAASHHAARIPFILFTRDEGWHHDDAFTCSAVRCMVKHEMTADMLKKAILQEVHWEKVRSVFRG